jgi:myo-inositol-1(or 4)-monophosphatase
VSDGREGAAASDPGRLVEAAAAAATAGAATSLEAWRDQTGLTVATKADADDLVTEADVRTQQAVFAALAERRPDDLLRGEEETGDVAGGGASGFEWWVDPIDGTTSFVYGRPDWAVSVAAVERSSGAIVAAAIAEPVLGRLTTAAAGEGAWSDGVRLRVPETSELARALVEVNLGTHPQRRRAGDMVGRLATGVRDIRRDGSAAVALAALAGGRCDAVWLPGLQIWDGAAGVLIAVEAGALVGDLGGVSGNRWPGEGDVLAAPPALFAPLRDLLAPAYGR